MKVNFFAPIISGSDKAESDQGLLELINGYVDDLSGSPAIKLRPGMGSLHNLGVNARVDLYWWEAKGFLIASCGAKIFAKTSRTGSPIEITPTLAADAFPIHSKVFFSADEHGVTMSAGQHMLWWGGNTSIRAQRVTGSGVPATITSLTYLKGYTIASILNSQQFAYAVYGPEDPRTAPPPWSPLYISASAKPDNIMCLAEGWEELFVLGRESTQSHYASGDATIPFPPLNGSVGDTGIVNSRTLCKLGNTWVFPTPDKQVVRMSGRVAQPISGAIEQELRRLSNYSEVEGFVLFNRFYVLNFFVDHRTFVFDNNKNIWYRWEAWDGTNARYRRFLGTSAVSAKSWGLQVVGGFDGRIYYMNHDLGADNGAAIRLQMRTGDIDHGTSRRKFSQVITCRLRRGLE